MLLEGLINLDADFDQLGETFDDCDKFPGFLKKDISDRGGRIKGHLGREAGAVGGKQIRETLPSARQISPGKPCLAGEANWKRMIEGRFLRFIKVICCR